MLGKPLVLLAEDDRGEAAEAASVVSKLITRDHVVALIGEQASSRTLAAAPIAQSYRVPMISPTSTNVEVTKKGDYIFRMCFIDPYQGQALATFSRRDLKAQTAAILVDARSDYSMGLAEAFRTAFTEQGGRVIDELKYTEGDSDFSAQLTVLAPKAPDVLVIPGYYTDAGLIARQARALGLKSVLLGADDSIATLTYDATRLLADAITRAGSTEGKRIRDALASTQDFAAVTGSVTMDADRNPLKSAVILKVDGGRFRFAAAIAPTP